jgi:predicted MFS family arabinose efflux permease
VSDRQREDLTRTQAASAPRRAALAPFSQRNFRLQWPADLVTSWAFEMETLLLGWFILVETQSVIALTAFGALQFVGTLLSPFLGVMADRVGHRLVLCAMRAIYALLAAALTVMAATGTLGPVQVFIVAGLAGLVRPSDIGIRNALIGATMPPPLLMSAMAIERCSADMARIAGALTGAGLVTALGMDMAYVAVVALYLTSLILTWCVREAPAPPRAAPTTPWRDLGAGLSYVRRVPPLMATLCLAFLVNFLAYPLTGGLLPFVARDIYGIDQQGLSLLLAGFSGGALAGSISLSIWGPRLPPARTALAAALLWFPLLLLFARIADAGTGMVLLVIIGFVQSYCMVPMTVVLLRVAEPAYRGRVMGLRMLAIYGLPVGLLGAGPLIERLGYAQAATVYAGFGLLCAVGIALFWRAHLVAAAAPANRGPA